jgi:16S rRNA (guanine1516-N2)-methyltransferase
MDTHWTPPLLTVQASASSGDAIAASLAVRLACHQAPAGEYLTAGWRLMVSADNWSLLRPDGVILTIDFTRGKAERRRQEPGLRRQPLARAFGIESFLQREGHLPSVVDTTAGLGQDAWLLAVLGCEVTLIERSALLHAMLQHALDQAAHDNRTEEIAARMTLVTADAVEWLGAAQNPVADMLYLDPMYPPRRKQAKVKKGMQFLHALLAPEQGNELLLPAALAAARLRVVVKRPQGAERLSGTDNWHGQLTEIRSPKTRFDVYHLHAE